MQILSTWESLGAGLAVERKCRLVVLLIVEGSYLADSLSALHGDSGGGWEGWLKLPARFRRPDALPGLPFTFIIIETARLRVRLFASH